MTSDIKTDTETLRRQLLLYQEKSAVAGEFARAHADHDDKHRATLFQVLSAHQSKLARRQAGVIE